MTAPPRKIDKARLIDLHQQGHSDKQIAAVFGCTPVAVLQARRRLGLSPNYLPTSRGRPTERVRQPPIPPPDDATNGLETVHSTAPLRMWLKLQGHSVTHTHAFGTFVDGKRYATDAELVAFVNRLRKDRGLPAFEVKP